MGLLRRIHPVKPVCGITFSPLAHLEDVLKMLEGELGTLQDRSECFDFTYTSYYEAEMGTGLKKLFVSFAHLADPGELPGWKLRTDGLEKKLSFGGKRTVNLDPGYVTGAKLVLASTKDFAHRVFLASAIYGDVQLRFIQDRFTPLEWTYPDYRSEKALHFFRRVRNIFMQEEKSHGQTASL